MPDGWEIQNGLDPLDEDDALLDDDSDGLVNLRADITCSPESQCDPGQNQHVPG